MRMKLFRKMLCLLVCALSLASCDFFSMFGGASSNVQQGPRYTGHYLFDLFPNPYDETAGVYYANKEGSYIVMENEEHHKGFLFNTRVSTNTPNDCSVTFDVTKGTYKSLCFFAGCAEDHMSKYQLNDSCAFSVWLDGERAYEDTFAALGPSRYVSIDISKATSIRFFVSKQFTMRCLGVTEVTLWEDANHSIAPEVKKATVEEDFLEHSYFVYGAGTNGTSTWESLDDGGFFEILDGDHHCYVNGEDVHSGIAFTTKTWFDADEYQQVVANALGRYKYLHFNLGHIEGSQKDGSVYLRVRVDGTVKLLEHISESDLPHDVTIELNYGKIICFEFYPDPEDKTRTDLFDYGSYCIYHMIGSPNEAFPQVGPQVNYDGSYRLISQVGKPFNFINAYERESSILTGMTAYAGIQMGGILYSEGLIMKSVYNMMTTTVGQISAQADFDIKGAFRYVTFKVGRRDKSALVSDTLKIHLDGELKQTIILNSMGKVAEYTVECANARKLTFELVGTSDTYRGTYGIVDIGVHTGEVKELSFSHLPNGKKAAADSYAKGQQVTMMRDILPYESFSGANEQDILTDDRKDTAEYTRDDGRSFQAGGQSHDEGFVLKTGTYLSMGGGAASGAMACMFVGFVLLVPMGAQDVNCASIAAFNLRGKFTSLTFSAAPLQAGNKSETLSLIGQNGSLGDITLFPNAADQYTVDVTGVEELVFFLHFSNGGSVPYGFYDMTLTAK